MFCEGMWETEEEIKSNFTSAILSARILKTRWTLTELQKGSPSTSMIYCYCYLRFPKICMYIGSLRAVEKGVVGSCTGLWPVSH